VLLYDGSGNQLATAFLQGTGVGPQIAFNPSVTIAIDPTVDGKALSSPTGAAADGAGNLFIADLANNRVVKVPAGGGAAIALSPTINGKALYAPQLVAVDGAGDLFISDEGNNRVVRIPAGGGAPVAIDPTVNGVGLNNPIGLAVDPAGDLFIADQGNSRVVMIPAGDGAPVAIDPNVNGESLSYPGGVAVDQEGDLFISDEASNRVVRIPYVVEGSAVVLNTTVNGVALSGPCGMAVDGAGNLFIADVGNGRVVEVPTAGYAIDATAIDPVVNGNALSDPQSLTVDQLGNLLIADTFNNRVVEVQRSQAPTLNFPTPTAAGTTDYTDGTQTVQVQNIGYNALTFTNLSYPIDFSEPFLSANPCTSSTSLDEGQSCNLNIDFTPQSADHLSESIMLIDNTLNVGGAQQSIGLDGTAFSPTTVTLSATSLSYSSQVIGTESVSQQVKLTNDSGSTLTITSISVTGANASSFAFTHNCPTKLAIGDSCTIHGHFAPIAAGPLTAAVTIADNAAGAPQSILLTGTGYAPPALSLSATSLVFPSQQLFVASASQSVTLTNTGGSTLDFISIGTTGVDASSFMFGNTCGTTLAAGASCVIHGNLTPTKTGALTASIIVTDKAAGSPQTISLSGTGINQLTTVSLSATSLSFGTVEQWASSPSQSVTLTNTGTSTLYITNLGYGDDAFAFAIGTTCGTTLAAGASCTFHCHFAPTDGSGSGSIIINDNVAGSPQIITLEGTETDQPTTVSLSATSLVFGSQEVGTSSPSQAVTLTNTGSLTLVVSNILLGGANPDSFVFENTCGSTLAAGATCVIHGHFAPTAAGPLTAVIYIDDTTTSGQQTITLSGTGYNPPAVTLSSTSLSFGGQEIETESASKQVTLTNTGGATLGISTISVTGANAPSFVFTHNCPTTLAIGDSCTIHGHFAPTAVGPQTAAVTITDNATNPTGSIQFITLTGTGDSPPAVSLSATSLSFGTQQVETESASQDVTLTNTGGTALSLQSIAVTGAGASSFVIAHDCPTSLAAGASCIIHGHFTPTTATTFAATVTITDNAAGSPQTIGLSGTGTSEPTTVSLSATSLAFPNQSVGTSSASQSVTLTNTSVSALDIASIVVTGPNASSFIFGNNCGNTLAAGASCTIHGHFAPTIPGSLSASVTITDSASGSPQTIALSGTGE
jgi:sugar lactone lactonase YvrE